MPATMRIPAGARPPRGRRRAALAPRLVGAGDRARRARRGRRRDRRRTPARGPRRARPARRCPAAGTARAASARASARRARAPSRRRPRRRPTARSAAPAATLEPATIRASVSQTAPRPPASARSSTSAAPGLEVRTSTNTPAPAARAPSTSGCSESTPSSGLAVNASAPQALDLAERRRRRPDERLRVGRGGDRDVAALAVGEHEQAALARVGDGFGERRPAVGAEALEAGELRLDRDAGRAGGVDQRHAVRAHCGRGTAARASRRPGHAASASGHSRAGSGSIPRTICDSRAATRSASRSAKGAVTRSIAARPAACTGRSRSEPLPTDGLLEVRGSDELRHARGGDLHRLAGARVLAVARARARRR